MKGANKDIVLHSSCRRIHTCITSAFGNVKFCISDPYKPRDFTQQQHLLSFLPLMDIYLWLAAWHQSKQQDRCQVWLMQPYQLSAHRAQDTKKDPEIWTVHDTLDNPLGNICLAALEKASMDIYLVYLFSVALSLCMCGEIHEERVLRVSFCWISAPEVTKC